MPNRYPLTPPRSVSEHAARLARQDEPTAEIAIEAAARFTDEDEARAAFLRTLGRPDLERLAVQGRRWDPRLAEIAGYLHSLGAGT